MKPCLRKFALLVSLASGIAVADDGLAPAQMLRWRCWYDQQVHITCLVDTIPEAGNQPVLALPPNLPAIVRQLRTDPAAFRHRFVHIPLHSPPFDRVSVALLARASMCGSRPDCVVDYSPTPPSESEIAALLGKNLSDPDDEPDLQGAPAAGGDE